ncbi:ATP-binding cassette domain-containing protein [Streptococcus gallolyticus]|nr:ATP-binding cassette domain-containing protein [Streptococcus gallolyticus]MBY5040414.1 ATP-binding cassette domain-containing protein [Streptococcus gallolyticus]
MEVVYCQQVRKEVAGRLLFDLPRLQLETGCKVGLIGENGAGKSSFLKILVGQDRDFTGQIEVMQDFAYLPQIKEETALSGGEQILQALKKALAQKPRLLLLDEPTANLDMENRLWLIHQLRKYRGSLLVVSHDRDFLNQIVTKIWYLEHQTIRQYQGNYDQCTEERQAERSQKAAAYRDYQAKVKQLQGVLEDKKVKAKKLTKKKKSVSSSDWKVNSRLGAYDGQAKAMAKNAKAIEKRIERMDKVEKPRKESWVKMEVRGQLDSTLHTLFRLKENAIFVEENYLFYHPELSMTFGQKVALLGRNGAGKTSFVRQLLSHQLDGYYADKLSVAYFSQNFSQLDLEKSAFDNARQTSEQDRVTILNLLAMLGIRYEKAQQKVATLSGGERVRLALAKVLLSDSTLLILDEPTNFLDVVTLEALETFLESYPGSLLLISHDPRFVGEIAEQIWRIEDGQLSLESPI